VTGTVSEARAVAGGATSIGADETTTAVSEGTTDGIDVIDDP
jgi:hypothetical protein